MDENTYYQVQQTLGKNLQLFASLQSNRRSHYYLKKSHIKKVIYFTKKIQITKP